MQKKLEAFFNQYGQTNAVRMRRVDGNKQFKVCFLHPVPKDFTLICFGRDRSLSSSKT